MIIGRNKERALLNHILEDKKYHTRISNKKNRFNKRRNY